jgi:hypothetical protein
MLNRCGRRQTVPDRSDQFRRAALECLQLARRASDENARTSLLMMAQRWFDLANGPTAQGGLDFAVREFNEGQMVPKQTAQQQTAQQQQQIQPKKDRS